MADVGEDIWATIDPEQMQRILDNLLENSLKYAEADELRIKVELSKKEQTAHLVFLDNGQGVSEEKLSHIFRRIFTGVMNPETGKKEMGWDFIL